MMTAASHVSLPTDIGEAAVLFANRVSKRFPGVLAVDEVSVTIARGEIVALLGPNGAGKSTFIQILSGVHPYGSYAGDIEIDGVPHHAHDVAAAEALGVAFVPQEINVAPELSIAETLALNAEPGWHGFIDRALMLAQAKDALAPFGLDLDPALEMSALDLSTRQLVIIARALAKNARLLILDEPTAALTDDEVARLFSLLRTLSSRGVAIIFVSHRLAEVFALANRIIVMRDGKVRGSWKASEISREAVVEEMVGAVAAAGDHAPPILGGAMLSVAGLVVGDVEGGSRRRVDGIDFTVAGGEVVGLFGLLGAGCIETALAIYGGWPGKVSGAVEVEGRALPLGDPVVAVARGLGLIVQDRREGLLLDQSIHDNIMLASLSAVTPRGFLDVGEARRRSSELVRRLDIKTPSIDTEVGALSGGNQQKVQVARWLASGARILILVDPTRGVDVGARAEIKRLWAELSRQGHAILVASTDSEELVDICDRVLVLRQGRVAAELARHELSEEALVRAAANV